MHWHVGTSGYSYKEWKGPFYPEKFSNDKMLSYYGERLPAVEINNTFYRMPRTSVLENWCEQVPEHFRFSIKASRRITHQKRLKETEEETGYLLGTLETLGERLGVVLFQLPPFFRKDLACLDAFTRLLPEGTPAAFEFRHASWFDDEVAACLRSRNFALCLADNDDKPAPDVISTADWGYFRLRRADYSDDDLGQWASAATENKWRHAFVFFKHEDEGTGPKMAARFLQLV